MTRAQPDMTPGGALRPVATPVARAQGSGNVVALTFDDGPSATTPALLDYLAANSLVATFAVIGENITAPGGADILKRIVAEGHTLCNHSTSFDELRRHGAALSGRGGAEHAREPRDYPRCAR